MIETFTAGLFTFNFETDALDLLIASCCGTVIGFERQLRQGLAGLRTNTLVALGGATYVVFARQFPDADPTRVAAQVVSGIGFLGAGVIFKDGLNVRGLNTAATIWCAAAVGIMAGAHHWGLAFFATILVTGINILLRPITHYLNRRLSENSEADTSYVTTIICPSIDEARIRSMLVHAFSEGDLHLHELDSTEIEGSDRVQIKASLYSDKKRPAALETIVGKLSVEPGVTSARWQAVQTFV